MDKHLLCFSVLCIISVVLADLTNIFEVSMPLLARGWFVQLVIPQIRISRFLNAYFIHRNSTLSATH